MNESTLNIRSVTHMFGKQRALDNVSLQVAAGERVALLGHNGAGKTTLFRVVLRFLRPTMGTADICGAAPGSDAARRITAYLPENVAFQKTLSGREVLRFYARMKGEDPRTAEALLERVGLAPAATKRVGAYSKGMRQRLALAQALIGAPRLLLLDEPTSGLDPLSRREFYEIIDEAANRGASILWSSHGLTEIEAKTDRVAILRAGQLVANDAMAGLRARAGLPIRIRVEARAGAADEVAVRLGGQRVNGRAVEICCPPSDKIDRLAAISALGPLVLDLDVMPPSLDDVYRYFSTGPGGRARS